MPTNLFTLQWTNTNTATTQSENIAYVSLFDIPSGGNGSFQNLNVAASSTTYVITWNNNSQGNLKYNLSYDFSVSATCLDQSISYSSLIQNKVRWYTPPTSLSTPSSVGEWNYVSTDNAISVWFDSQDLMYCRQIEIGLYTMAGSLVSGTSVASYISPSTSNGPTSFADNLKRVYFTGSGITPDTQYKVKLKLYAQQTDNNYLSTTVEYNVFTKPTNPAYKQWIVVVGDTISDPCNIKYQTVVQTDPGATANSIQSGLEHLFTNYLAPQMLGPVSPVVSPTLNLNYIRLLGGNNRVYNYDPVGSIFGATTANQCSI